LELINEAFSLKLFRKTSMEIPPKFHHEKIPNPKNHPESKPKKARP
jgi:hypothetical protein